MGETPIECVLLKDGQSSCVAGALSSSAVSSSLETRIALDGDIHRFLTLGRGWEEGQSTPLSTVDDGVAPKEGNAKSCHARPIAADQERTDCVLGSEATEQTTVVGEDALPTASIHAKYEYRSGLLDTFRSTSQEPADNPVVLRQDSDTNDKNDRRYSESEIFISLAHSVADGPTVQSGYSVCHEEVSFLSPESVALPALLDVSKLSHMTADTPSTEPQSRNDVLDVHAPDLVVPTHGSFKADLDGDPLELPPVSLGHAHRITLTSVSSGAIGGSGSRVDGTSIRSTASSSRQLTEVQMDRMRYASRRRRARAAMPPKAQSCCVLSSSRMQSLTYSSNSTAGPLNASGRSASLIPFIRSSRDRVQVPVKEVASMNSGRAKVGHDCNNGNHGVTNFVSNSARIHSCKVPDVNAGATTPAGVPLLELHPPHECDHLPSLHDAFPNFPEMLYLSTDRLRILRDCGKDLGKGSFGVVYLGELYPPGTTAPLCTPMCETSFSRASTPETLRLGATLRGLCNSPAISRASEHVCFISRSPSEVQLHQQPYNHATACFYNRSTLHNIRSTLGRRTVLPMGAGCDSSYPAMELRIAMPVLERPLSPGGRQDWEPINASDFHGLSDQDPENSQMTVEMRLLSTHNTHHPLSSSNSFAGRTQLYTDEGAESASVSTAVVSAPSAVSPHSPQFTSPRRPQEVANCFPQTECASERVSEGAITSDDAVGFQVVDDFTHVYKGSQKSLYSDSDQQTWEESGTGNVSHSGESTLHPPWQVQQTVVKDEGEALSVSQSTAEDLSGSLRKQHPGHVDVHPCIPDPVAGGVSSPVRPSLTAHVNGLKDECDTVNRITPVFLDVAEPVMNLCSPGSGVTDNSTDDIQLRLLPRISNRIPEPRDLIASQSPTTTQGVALTVKEVAGRVHCGITEPVGDDQYSHLSPLQESESQAPNIGSCDPVQQPKHSQLHSDNCGEGQVGSGDVKEMEISPDRSRAMPRTHTDLRKDIPRGTAIQGNEASTKYSYALSQDANPDEDATTLYTEEAFSGVYKGLLSPEVNRGSCHLLDSVSNHKFQPSTEMKPNRTDLRWTSAHLLSSTMKTSEVSEGLHESRELASKCPTSMLGDSICSGAIPFRSVAVKVICKTDLDRMDVYRTFQSEVLMSSRLHHPCIINTFGVAEDDQDVFLVMDLAENGTVGAYAKRCSPDEMQRMAPRFLADVVLALEYFRDGAQHPIHAQGAGRERMSQSITYPRPTSFFEGRETAEGTWEASASTEEASFCRSVVSREVSDRSVPLSCTSSSVSGGKSVTNVTTDLETMHHNSIVVHRDIKPENLLLTWDYHVKVGDFGAACFMGDAEANRFVGTIAYMSPEMIERNTASPSSDLWAMGCMLYELLGGVQPFLSPTPYLTMQKIKTFEPVMLSFSSVFSEEAKDLITRLLQREPELRLGSASCGGFAALKKHPFFAKIDWDCVLNEPNILLSSMDYTAELADFLLPNEQLLYCSPVANLEFRHKLSFCPIHLMVLTETPRLFLIDPNTNEVTNTISWSKRLQVEVKSVERFVVHCDSSATYEFFDKNHRADLWGVKINELVMRQREARLSTTGLGSTEDQSKFAPVGSSCDCTTYLGLTTDTSATTTYSLSRYMLSLSLGPG